MSARYTEAVV